jgi:hypothetical protein
VRVNECVARENVEADNRRKAEGMENGFRRKHAPAVGAFG